MEVFGWIVQTIEGAAQAVAANSPWQGVMLIALFLPGLVVLELPLVALVVAGAVRHWFGKRTACRQQSLRYGTLGPVIPFRPLVTCVLTAYAEGDDIVPTVRTLVEQDYQGSIEILIVVDGAAQNRSTYEAAMRSIGLASGRDPQRTIQVIPKSQRGGRVSSNNLALGMARGEVLFLLDGDTSFSTEMVSKGVAHFANEHTVALAGSLRVRNEKETLLTRIQSLEYLLSIHLSKTGLGAWGIVNTISGALGVFRVDFVRSIGGWINGTAEDHDLVIRMKSYLGRYRHLTIAFDPEVIGYTDVPTTMDRFLKQRRRWDGDLFYLYVRKHLKSLHPALMGWKQFLLETWLVIVLQMTMPFVITLYLFASFLLSPPEVFIASSMLVYGLYVLKTLFLWLVAVVFVSEQKQADARLVLMIPLLPALNLVTKISCAYAVCAQFLDKAFLDSSMAPWWVLKRTKL